MNHDRLNKVENQDENLSSQEQELIRVGLTQGDFNGIGYEVILKALSEIGNSCNFIPVLYGSSKIVSYHRKTLSIPDLPFNHVRKASQIQAQKVNIVNITDKEIRVSLGQSTPEAGEMAYLSLKEACKDLEEELIDVLVTAPINKYNIQSDEFQFIGHTEYLAHRFNAHNTIMIMVNNDLKLGFVTNHLPIRQIADAITTELIYNKIKALDLSLFQDFGISHPKIAVLSLNPHAGDNGLLGNEEKDIISPAIHQAYEEGILAFGPYPADGFFGMNLYKKFEGVLAMYHDQALPVFKLLAQGYGVNFTAGLPFVRTSPTHGTAYDIAGKDLASHYSMREAIYLAIDIFKNRQEYAKMTANPLRYSTQHGPEETEEEEL
ncbi:MAG: 4-hydroxythreonine-4-phosphate dehydrogenase [Bacteroidetes bacterium 38_7]|nr:MAG: 4-hydroxythreonine-4-phosphate dehydrogenase [Bacteroidetes bacterium 38_7]HAL65902.1 4-hydroxythreonine-4-phosphate dehydrogenase PdxA [Bacteroidales bacterium]